MTWERTTRAQLAASGSVQPRVRVVTGGETLVVEQARVDGHLLRGRVRGGAPVALDLTHVESIALRRRASEPTDALIGVGILAVCVAAFGAVMVASSSANHEPPSPPPSSSATLRSNDALALLYLFAILFGGP